MRTLLLALVIILCCACGGCGGATSTEPTTPASGEGAAEVGLGVIIPESRAAEMVAGMFEPAPSGYWTPERGQVAALEASISEYLAGAAPEGSRLRSGLDGYQAQYLGILREEREVIFANFFCHSHVDDITQSLVAVDDGGDCYFTVEYDPAADSFADLAINGEGQRRPNARFQVLALPRQATPANL